MTLTDYLTPLLDATTTLSQIQQHTRDYCANKGLNGIISREFLEQGKDLLEWHKDFEDIEEYVDCVHFKTFIYDRHQEQLGPLTRHQLIIDILKG